MLAALPTEAAAASPPTKADMSDKLPQAEGFFFVIPGKKANGTDDLDGDRVFFISSSWLPFFELTNTLSLAPADVTITPGSPGTVTWVNNDLKHNDGMKFLGTDLPNPISPDVAYFVH